jgi:hypothetical protein
MKTRRWFALFVVFILIGGPCVGEGKQGRHSFNQVDFTAEDSGVKQPVALPDDVLEILKKDATVQSVLENENLPPEKLPPSWFSASTIHLSTANRKDLVVVGQPPVSGANVTTFWVFRATPRGYELVLTAPAHSLTVRNSRWRGFRDIELVSATAVQVSTVLCRFDGKRYAEYKSKSEPIH